VTARFKANHWPSPAQPKPQLCKFGHTGKVTVTVTEALVLRPPLEDRAHITVNLYLAARRQNETKCFQITTKQVRRSQQFQLRR